MDDDQKVTIQVTNSVREQLRAAKQGGETYADVMERILASYDPAPDTSDEDEE